MQLPTRILTAASVAALFTVFGSVRPATAVAQAAAPKLDDPTIVAIFDAANTFDMETGSPQSIKVTPRLSVILAQCWCAIIATSESRVGSWRSH